jgi:hypothetical protein
LDWVENGGLLMAIEKEEKIPTTQFVSYPFLDVVAAGEEREAHLTA